MMEAIATGLEGVLGKQLNVSLETSFDGTKEMAKYEAKLGGREAVIARLEAVMKQGMIGHRTDSVLALLSKSARAATKFASAINAVVVQCSPPATVQKASSNDLSCTVMGDTLMVVVKLAVVDYPHTSTSTSWAIAVDNLFGLCALTDGYIDAVNKKTLPPLNNDLALAFPGLVATVDWSFIEHANYRKLAEDTRQVVIAGMGTFARGFMQDRSNGFLPFITRSPRAVETVCSQVQTVIFTVDAENKVCACF